MGHWTVTSPRKPCSLGSSTFGGQLPASGPVPETDFRPLMLSPGASQSVATALPVLGHTSLFRPQPSQLVQVPAPTSVPASQSVATALPVLGHPSLFRPQPSQPVVPVPVPTPSSVPAVSPLNVVQQGATFTSLFGTGQTSTLVTPTLPVLNEDHGTYNPSSPVVLAPTQSVSIPNLTNSLPILEATNPCLPGQPIPQTQSEKQP